MKSLNAKYVPEVDQLRAIAALLVLFFHTTVTYFLFLGDDWIKVSNPLKLFVVEGHLGVSLFFVLSGFIFTWATYNHEKLNLKNFYTNRFLRIYPLFILVLLVAISAKRAEFDFVFFVQSLIGFGNYGAIPFYNDFMSVLWTIAVELQFYLLFPWLLLLLKKKGIEPLLGILAVVTILRVIVFELSLNINDLIYWTLPGRIDQFITGMILAYIFLGKSDIKIFRNFSKDNFSPTKARVLFVISILVLIVCIWIYNNIGGGRTGDNLFKAFWPSIDGLMWAFFAGAYILAKFKSRVTILLAFIGTISYSVYLLHWPIMKAIGENGLFINTSMPGFYDSILNIILIVAPTVIIISYISYKYIESPFLNLRKKY